MLLHVLHETRYDYSPAVENAQHVAYLRPLETDGQRVIRHSLQISPDPAHQRTVADLYGNSRSYFSFQSSHAQLAVKASSLVQTAPAMDHQDIESAPWQQVCEHLRYQAGAPWEPAVEFVFDSPCLPHDDAFAEFAKPSFTGSRPIALAAWDLMQRIHRHMRYESQSTDVTTPALQALRQGKGVCQDFAHILVACCRSMGLAARYVSGYLLTVPPPGQSRLIGSDASHAWASVYCPHAGPDGQIDVRRPGIWLDLDPTNDRCPGEDYVTLARGRDFLDVSPLRGVIQGSASHKLSVAVTVTQVAANTSAAAPGA
jgi:transglutaminase-like putative cysteine protease